MSGSTQSPQKAPCYACHRKGVTAADSLPVTDRKMGMVMEDHRLAHVQVLPSGGANPSVEVLFWSEAAGAFIKTNAATTKAGMGADVPYEFTVEAAGRRLLVAFTTLSAGAADVYVAGACDL